MALKKTIKGNALLNLVKQTCSIIFPLITFPYAVRVLGVERYGTVNYCSSIVTYFALFAALGLQNYGIREGARIRNDKKKLSVLANQLFTINGITTIISLTIFMLVLYNWNELYRNRFVLLIQALIIPFSFLGCEWINIVFEDYKYITIRYLLLQSISLVAMLLLVRSKADYLVYAGITTFAQAGAGLLNIFYIRKKYLKVHIIFKNIDFIRHIKPLIVLFAITASSYIYINADITMIGLFCGEVDVGFYSAATKIYNLVKMMINAIIVVTIPRISLYLGEGKIEDYNNLINRVVGMMGIIVLPCVVGLIMLAQPVIAIVCGEEYVCADFSLKVLSLAMLFAPFSYIYSSGVLVSNKKDSVFLLATAIGAVVNVLLNVVLIPTAGFDGAAITTLISELIVYAITRNTAVKLYEEEKSGWIVDSLVGCVGIIIICKIISKIINGNITICIVSVLLSVIFYFFVMYLRKNSQFYYLIEQIKCIKK